MKNLKTILQSRVFYIFLFLITMTVVIFHFLIPRKSVYDKEISKLTGIVISYKIDGDLVSMVLQAKEKIQCFYYLKSLEEKKYFEMYFGYGTEVEILGKLKSPEANTIPNTFNYRKYLYYQNIYYLFEIKEMSITKQAVGISWLKNAITKKLQRYQHNEYILSLVLGNKTLLDTTNITANGISHLFAISGMHISLLVVLLSFLLKKAGSKINVILGLSLLFYLYLVGFTPSVMRACFFFLGGFLNERLQLSLSKKQIFFLVLCIILLINPFFIMNLGFQYSFLISYCLLGFKASKNYIVTLIRISLLSFFLSLPITAMNFYSVNFLSILWNLFFVPFVSFFLYPCCLLFLVFPFIEPFFSLLISVFEGINNWCASITFGVLIIPKLSLFFWGFYYLLFYLFAKTRKKAILFFLCFTFIIGRNYPKFSPHAYVYFIDVGQGDSTLFVAPHQREIILIDTGGKMNSFKKEWQQKHKSFEQAETLKTFFHSLGISSLSSLVITHGDIDHGGNSLSLLEKMKVKEIILNNNVNNDLEKRLISKYSEKLTTTLRSKFFKIQDYSKVAQNENDSSLIYQINVFQTSFLMMGDASSSIEAKLLNQNIKSDIIKVGHHGSKTSSSTSFLKRVNPSFAIISVGENNRYGHPSEETLKRFDNLEIPYLLTSIDGTVWFKIDAKKLKIHSIKQNT